MGVETSDFVDPDGGCDATDDDARFTFQIEGLLITDGGVASHLLNF